jgi:hypothetical protein
MLRTRRLKKDAPFTKKLITILVATSLEMSQAELPDFTYIYPGREHQKVSYR